VARWPEKIPPGTVLNGIMSHADWFTTFLSAAGVPDIADRLKTGTELDGTHYKVHLDGHDQLPYLTGEVDESPRDSFYYVSDDGALVAMRYDNWKFVFVETRVEGTLQLWMEPPVVLRMPKLFNLRTDPYERADQTSNTYFDWMLERAFLFVPAQSIVAETLQSLIEFPPRQEPASFSIDQVMEKLQQGVMSS
jgi:arylsulfatase A-like enzyme